MSHRGPASVACGKQKLWGLAFLLLVLLAQTCSADETLWEFTPYRVHAVIAFTPAAEQCGNVSTNLTAALEARAWAVVGARWTFSAAVAAPAVREAVVYGFQELKAEQILPTIASDDFDKVLLVRLDYQAGTYDVAIRDFDVRAQLISAPQSARVYHRARLADAIFQTLLAAFAPLARVEDVAGDKVSLQLRAAAVPTRDPSLATVAEKSIFRPVVRRTERAGRAPKVLPIEWTYLISESVEGSHVMARLITGLRAPLSTRRRRSTEQLALFVHLPDRDTTLELRTPDKAARPLVGYQVYSHPVDSKETQLLGATDTRGDLRIPPGDGGVRVLLVKSGGMIMAKLPLLPGLAPVVLAQMPDDNRRLQVEGLIAGFQEELVDTIARRQVLMSRVRSRMKAGKTQEAKLLFEQLRRLRSQQDFTRQLLVERQRRATGDPRTQRQIDKLFDDTQTVINRTLDSRQIDRLERELGGDETAQAAPPAQDGS